MPKNQPHIKGEESRITGWACIHPDTSEDVELLAKEYGVSRSWIVAFALETFLYGTAFTKFPDKPKRNGKKIGHR